MKTSLSLLAVFLVGTAVLIDQWAYEAAVRDECSAATAGAPVPAVTDPVRPTPFQREIRAVVDSARVVEARLMAELGDEASPDHPAVRAHRRATTVRLLELQARHAAARGRHDLERRIRANLAELRSPAPADRTLARNADR